MACEKRYSPGGEPGLRRCVCGTEKEREKPVIDTPAIGAEFGGSVHAMRTFFVCSLDGLLGFAGETGDSVLGRYVGCVISFFDG